MSIGRLGKQSIPADSFWGFHNTRSCVLKILFCLLPGREILLDSNIIDNCLFKCSYWF